MAGPWDKYAAPQAPQPVASPPVAAAGPWAKYAAPSSDQSQTTAQVAPADQSYTGQILPFSKDAQGNTHFDSNAGVLGMAKRAFEGAQSGATAVGDAATGKLQVMDAQGNVTPEAIQRALDFAMTFSPMNPGITAGDKLIPGVAKGATTLKPATIEAPTVDALKAAASAGYDRMRDMGVDYSSDAVKTMANSIQAGLEQDGVIKELAPKSFAVLDKLQNPPSGSVAPLSGLEAARRAFNNAGKDFTNPTDQLAAQRAREGIDQFIIGSDPTTVAAGPAQEAAQALQDARGNYAAAKRSDTINGVQDAAELSAAAANSGQNLGNSIRQRVKSVLLSPKKSAGFSDDEIDQLRSVVEGSTAANASRYVGNLLGGGGGLGGMLTGVAGAGIGASTGSPLLAAAGATVPLIGHASKEISRILTERALSQADKATRLRSPLAQALIDATPKEAAIPTKQAALVKALMLAGESRRNNGGGGGF